jgi:hypothetical protein
LPGLASNHNPPDFSLPSSLGLQGVSHQHMAPCSSFLLHGIANKNSAHCLGRVLLVITSVLCGLNSFLF